MTLETATRGRSSSRVMALAHGDRVTILRDRCADPEACIGGAELEEETVALRFDHDRPDQILLSSSGRWLTYRYGAGLFRVDLDADHVEGEPYPIVPGPTNVEALVGSLRGADWVLYRDGDGLRALNVASSLDEPAQDIALGETDLGLLAAALGDRNVVARRVLSGDEEELYLVAVNPSHKHDRLDAGQARLLARGRPFSRVVITRGPTPAELGTDQYDEQPDVPIDTFVIATTGTGKQARTAVYDVETGELVDSFNGAAASGHLRLEEIEGISAVSPDASHLAYITGTGALAMRNVGTQSSCLVRPSSAGHHRVAGFAADGTLFFESEETSRDDYKFDRVFSYEPDRRRIEPLTPERSTFRLQGAPSRAYDDGTGQRHPWAMAVSDGLSYAVQPNGVVSPRGLDDPSFLPQVRADRPGWDQSLWVIDAEDEDDAGMTQIRLRRVQPEGLNHDGVIQFGDGSADPLACSGAACESNEGLDVYSHRLPPSRQVCLSADRTQPWGTRCAVARDRDIFMAAGIPTTEQ